MGLRGFEVLVMITPRQVHDAEAGRETRRE